MNALRDELLIRTDILIYLLSAYSGQSIVLGHWGYGSTGLAPLGKLVHEMGCQKHIIHKEESLL